jgi:tetratricopeptide (TPR) repeat protein
MKIIRMGSIFQLMLVFTTFLRADPYLMKADSLFENRFVGFDAERILADSVAINKAIGFYQQAIDVSTLNNSKREAIWKLLRAYYFKGNFTTDDIEEKQQIFSRGTEIGENYIDQYPESVEMHCWLGILWGYWGEVHSSFTAARKGVPGKVKYYAEKTIQLDDRYLDAGGYRMLGRLHLMVPNIPLVMGWPSKEKSLKFLRKACTIAPDNLLNKLYLAETLHATGNKGEAKLMLEEIVHTGEIVHDIIVDTWVKKEAQRLMEKLFPANGE